jgi:hypothetical protein
MGKPLAWLVTVIACSAAGIYIGVQIADAALN